jgi:hypothetical protein
MVTFPHDRKAQLSLALLAIGALVLISSACGLFTIGSSNEPTGPVQPPPPDRTANTAAAKATANQSAGFCADIRPFYWEIGDRNGPRASGSVIKAGVVTVYTAQSPMPIASASKWMYGAYVGLRRAGFPTLEDIRFLTFRSGYTNFSTTGCDNTDTVQQCVDRGTNGVQTAANVGKFFYDGGHMQKHASLPEPGMNLGALSNAALAGEMRRVLGTDINIDFTQPQLAGGIRTTPAAYGLFLRKILSNQIRFGFLLGTSATCTNPLTCPTAVSTPISPGLSWSYSLGHWVENDPVSGDGAYSSPGAFGFYPWINQRVDTYGIVARVDVAGSGLKSAQCGALIRKAWETAVAQ